MRSNSTAQGLTDLGGRKVCATSGSTSLTTVRTAYAKARPMTAPPKLVLVAYWTDCLVLLQQGDVTAISTDDSLLAGLAAQDPYTKIVGPPLADEPYGLAISKQHSDFVRFVNAVLARLRADASGPPVTGAGWAAGPPPRRPPVTRADRVSWPRTGGSCQDRSRVREAESGAGKEPGWQGSRMRQRRERSTLVGT